MAVNLIELATSYLPDNVVDRVSRLLDENPQNTQTALNGAFPTLLSGLAQRSAEPGGTSSVMDLVAEVTTPDRVAGEVVMPQGTIVNRLGNLANNDDDNGLIDHLQSIGSGILSSLFGDRSGAVAGALASYSGVKQSSAQSLLSLAGSVLLAIIGKQQHEDGEGPTNLAGLLSSQTGSIQSAMPSGFQSLLGSIPGFGALGGFVSGLGGIGAGMGDTVTRTAETVMPAAAPVPPKPIPTPATPLTPTPVEPVEADRPVAGIPAFNSEHTAGSGKGTNWLPWLLLGLGVIALIFFLRSCRTDESRSSAVVSTDSSSAESRRENTAEAIEATADSAASDVSSVATDANTQLGTFFKRKLSTGTELNIPERGIENNLIRFIEDKNRAVDKTTWFNFDRLLFDTGKATLKPASQEQVNNIAEVLKAYPNVNVKIGGYTDNTGNAKTNQKLSTDRANTVMNALVAEGITKGRLEAEGYGQEHPAASNETEAGRAQNRRIAVRVTKK